MCEFFDIQASGDALNAQGIPGSITASGRVTLDCGSVIVQVFDNSNNLVFETTVQPGANISDFNGTPTRLVIASFDNGHDIQCGDRVTVTLTCATDPNCTLTTTVALVCKDDPVQPCPDANAISIILTSNGVVVSPDVPCFSSGAYSAEATGVPAGSQIFWTLDLGGTASSLPATNPTTFSLPAGTAPASLSVVVITPNCPPIARSIGLPDREEGNCSTQAVFEVRKDGQLVTATTGLASGTYQVTVTSPVASGNIYNFQDANGSFQVGSGITANYTLMGNGASLTILVTVDVNGCCPAVSGTVTLSSADDAEDPPVEEPPVENPPNDDDDDDWVWPSLCGWLYLLLMLAVLAFIGLWIASFTLFPASTALWVALGVALVVVVAALAIYTWVCNVSWCRRLRILGWMFGWCALGCIIAWAVSWFTLWFLLVGALIAGVIALIIGLMMARRNCDFLDLFAWP